MTLDDFITKYTNKGIDYDGAYGFQCVDLYRQYVKEVLGYPQSKPVPGAKDIWDSYLPEYYERIANTPTGVPKVGDIMIWGSAYGSYGHVAVVTGANEKTFSCFSQNDPIGKLCGIKNYSSYKGVLGWLHPKTTQTTQEQIDSLRKERDDNWNLYQETKTQLEQAQSTIKAYSEFQQTLSQKLDTDNQTTSIIGAVERFLSIEDQLSSANSKYETERIEKEELETKVKGMEVHVANAQAVLEVNKQLTEVNTSLQNALDTCAHDLTIANEKKQLDKLTTGELFKELLNRLVRR